MLHAHEVHPDLYKQRWLQCSSVCYVYTYMLLLPMFTSPMYNPAFKMFVPFAALSDSIAISVSTLSRASSAWLRHLAYEAET